MMYNYGYGYNYGDFHWLGALGMIIWWALIISLIVYLVKWIGHGTKEHRSHSSNAMEILKERYAKGEIDRKDFEEKKKDLS